MSYATLALLTERYGERTLIQLTDRDTPGTGAIVEEVVDRALADADAVIDGYVGSRYLLPIAETPPLLSDLAAAIALYKLHRATVPEKFGKEYDAAIATLKDVAKGLVRLPIAGIEPASSGAEGVQTVDRDRDMTPENMRGLI
jgi:phage gp36-like protein